MITIDYYAQIIMRSVPVYFATFVGIIYFIILGILLWQVVWKERRSDD